MQSQSWLLQRGQPAPHMPSGRETCDNVLTSTDMRLSTGGCIGGLFVLLVALHCASYFALTRQTKRS